MPTGSSRRQEEGGRVQLDVVQLDNPQGLNVVLGQAHFIKTLEDLHEVLVGSSPHLRFGIAFCESSGPRLIRRTGNDPRADRPCRAQRSPAGRRARVRAVPS
jgi:adenosine/AMP kinase